METYGREKRASMQRRHSRTIRCIPFHSGDECYTIYDRMRISHEYVESVDVKLMGKSFNGVVATCKHEKRPQ